VTESEAKRHWPMSFSTLIIDDAPDVSELFHQRFRREVRDGSFVLHFAASDEDGLRRLAELHPELIVILSDINMLGMDGLGLLRWTKELRPELPVLSQWCCNGRT
jgi:CheY-like chemotaxis protein